MTGWRIGYICCPNPETVGQIIKMQYYITACSNDAMQYAVLTAFDEASSYPEEMAKEFQARRDLICERLNAMPGVSCHVPKGAFYVFPKMEVPGMTSEELAIELLHGAFCFAGSAFGESERAILICIYHCALRYSAGMDKVELFFVACEGVRCPSALK